MTEETPLPIQGPKITWNRDEVLRSVELYGKEDTIQCLAYSFLRPEYVRQVVDALLDNALVLEGNEYSDTSFYSQGTA